MWCTTECWDCEDRKCEHYISKTELYFENQRLKSQLQQKENIIKEVREYIEEKEKDDDNWIDYELCIEPIVIKEMLEKENKDEFR